MKGLFRPLATAVIALAVLLPATAGLAEGSSEPGTPRPAATSPGGTDPSPTALCPCVSPQDLICWESCPVPVTVTPPASRDVAVHYRTVPGSAKPGVDYIPVDDGLVVIPAGKPAGQAMVQPLPAQPGPDKTFQVVFFGLSYGTLVRQYAVVTIRWYQTGQPS